MAHPNLSEPAGSELGAYPPPEADAHETAARFSGVGGTALLKAPILGG